MTVTSEHRTLRRTKIIATLGPSTDDPEVMRGLIQSGLNLARLNFSHGSHEEHLARMELVRRVAQEEKAIVGILADLQGPKIRVSNFIDGGVELLAGDSFILDAGLAADAGTQARVGIDYKELPNDVHPHDTLLLDDGRLVFTVREIKGLEIHCTVVVGGRLSNHKGINRRGGGLTAPALTDKDKQDLAFVMQHDVEYVAISFPRNAADMQLAKDLIAEHGGDAGVIAKIERVEAMAHIDEIIQVSDGVMVARGDLAVEIGDAHVPVAQKHIIKRARTLDKPVIIATQMMESMIHSTVATRAEVSDVANAVLDYADAVMLSAESAVGDHPVDVVTAMSRICLVAEQDTSIHSSGHRLECRFGRVDEAVAMAAMYMANHLDVVAVVALTESGSTPLWMSRIKTAMPIYGLSQNRSTLGRMTLYRGVYPVEFYVTDYARDEVNQKAAAVLEAYGAVKHGDIAILTKGDLMGVGGGANAVKVLKIGEVA
jgi:pyruvate kinase